MLHQSGRIRKFIVSTGEPREGETLDKLQLFLPNGDAIDLSNLEAPEAAPQFNPRGDWVAGEYQQGDAVMVENSSYWASETTSEEPGVTGAPLTPDDLFQTIWVAPAFTFDTTNGSSVTDSDDPWTPDVYSEVLYVPVTHVGHLQIALDTFDDHYVSYSLVRGSDMSLQGTGASDTSIGFDFDSLGAWYIQMYHDPGFDSGHDAGAVIATAVYSAGLTVTPAPATNPWIRF